MSEESDQLPVDDSVIEAFDHAQRQTIALMRKVVSELRAGQTPNDVHEMARSMARPFGFDDWFHLPHVRFGAPKSPGRTSGTERLSPGMIVEIDLAPSTKEAFGDFGYALAFETEDEPKLLQQSRELCRAACGFSNRFKCTGEVFVFAQAWAVNRGLGLGKLNSIGHRCFPRQGRTAWQWPKVARAAILLRRNQVQWFNHRRMSGFYALQPRLVSAHQGISFEEMIFVMDHDRRILGRDSIDEVGTL